MAREVRFDLGDLANYFLDRIWICAEYIEKLCSENDEFGGIVLSIPVLHARQPILYKPSLGHDGFQPPLVVSDLLGGII